MSPLTPSRERSASERGFTLVEMLLALGITTLILGATMGVLADAVRAADAATLITGLNGSLRTGLDLMVRDLLEGGQGLPSGRVIQIPSGTGATPIRVPGPPSTAYVYTGTAFCPPPTALCAQISAVIPGPGRGPLVGGLPTDMITVLAADSAFDQVRLTAFASTGTTITVGDRGPDNIAGTADDVNITDGGPDDLDPGDLLMLVKGSSSTLAQVSSVAGQVVTFTVGDSLLLNQRAAADGTLLDLRNTAPADVVAPIYVPTTATRIRMISYYLDATTDPLHPRLVRRLNNGNATTFNNDLGTAVAFDIDNLSISYDLADNLTTRSNVRLTATDLQGGGACGAAACSPNQVRKVNILLSGRSRVAMRNSRQFFRNRLLTQVSLRSMAFVDRYR